MSAGGGVGAHDDLEILVLDRPLEHVELERDAFFSRLEPLFRVVAGAEVAWFVLEVVLRDEADVGLEVRTVLRHQRELTIGQLTSMRDGRAAGEYRGTSGGRR